MELPSIRSPHPPPAALPSLLTATVEAVLAPHRYQLRVHSLLLEAELDLLLQVGDSLPLRVRQQSSAGLVLEVLPRESSLPSLHHPRPAPLDSDPELVRHRAPLDPGTVERVRSLPPDLRPAAAFLAGHGLEPDGPLAAVLSALDGPGPDLSTAAPILQDALRALLERVAPAPDQAAAKLPLSLLGAPPDLDQAVARALASSPRLRQLDALIEGLAALPPRPGPPALDAARALLHAASPDAPADELIARLPPLSRDSIRELLAELRDLERLEIRALPELARARELPGGVPEASERAAAFRLVNQLSMLRGDGIQVFELPLRRHDGSISRIPLVVRREGGGGGSGGTADSLSITVHADLPRLGLVHAFLQSSGRLLRVRLTARTGPGVADLERELDSLRAALERIGFEASVFAELARDPGRPSIFDVFAAPGSPGQVDVQA